MYTELFRDFGRRFSFEFPAHWNDNAAQAPTAATRGRYTACHAEKQLALFWLRRQLRVVFGSSDLANAGRLKSAALPEPRRKAVIVLGHNPCTNCRDFLDFIRDLSGLVLVVKPRPALQLQSTGKGGLYELCARTVCGEQKRKDWPTIHSAGGKPATFSNREHPTRPKPTTAGQVEQNDETDLLARRNVDKVAADDFGRLTVRLTPEQGTPLSPAHPTQASMTVGVRTPPRTFGQTTVPGDWPLRSSAAKVLPGKPVAHPSALFGGLYAQSAARSAAGNRLSVDNETALTLSIEYDEGDEGDEGKGEEPSPSVLQQQRRHHLGNSVAAKKPDLRAFLYAEPREVSQLTSTLCRSSLPASDIPDRPEFAHTKVTKVVKAPVLKRRFARSTLPNLCRRYLGGDLERNRAQ